MSNEFKFGIETEYLVLDKKSFSPLWHYELNFKSLYKLIESIPIDDLPSLEGLDEEGAHEKVLPYVIEGYHIKDDQDQNIDMMPKGIEIRTPVCSSIEKTLQVLKTLFQRLKTRLESENLLLCSLSHHPLHYEFDGPRCNRRHDFWLWAKEVMTTYGPDINISFPKSIQEKLFGNQSDFEAKLAFYAPALTAYTLNSPFYKGSLKKDFNGNSLKSIRTFRRSTIAPLIEWHADENHRIEFKFFEMSNSAEDFKAYFQLCLGLALCDELQHRALKPEGIYLMGEVATHGVKSNYVQNTKDEILEKVPKALDDWGFDSMAMERLLSRSSTPADDLINEFLAGNQINKLLEQRCDLR